ncbi:MAG: hypothetical protein LUC33_03890 [Prevotellaceae bacterium]|nr:hypothetical protein [Prevotellaceae bacterium]
MKSKIFSLMTAAAVLLASSILWSACTDTWDDHYGTSDGSDANNPSLLANIAADPELSNFYRLVQAIGVTDQLASPQELTVWAPVGLTSAQVDSVIAVYETEQASGKADEDNKAMTQFYENHVALYRRQVSSLTNDTVAMLNGKYMSLLGTSNTSGTLEGNAFSGEVDCYNGILYKADNIQTFFPNIREYIELQADLDSVADFFVSYDEYELDENSSVAGGVVDGKTVYLDSVTNLKNDFLTKYGYIQREDSSYYFIVPTNDVWNAEYAKYHPYYTYLSDQENADSLSDAQTKTDILCGRFFNISKSSKYNYNPADSLCNTQYNVSQSHNPRQNVYYKPETGILSGLEKVECSNGYVYIDDKGVIDPTTTFFGRSDIEASSARYYVTPTNTTNNNETMNVSPGTYVVQNTSEPATQQESEDIGDVLEEEEGSGTSTSTGTAGDSKTFNYITVLAKTPTQQTQMDYKIYNNLANCYYNIYLVTVPDYQTNLPLWFTMSQCVKTKADFDFTNASFTYFNNPNPVTAGSVDNSETILSQSNNQRCYVASAEKVDTILIQAAVKYSYSGVGLDDEVVRLRISSFGPASASSREKIYTRTLRLNEIIMVPFETEAEALAAAEDIDAFNDDLLEANKEN